MDEITANRNTYTLQNVLAQRPQCNIAIVNICARCIQAKCFLAEQVQEIFLAINKCFSEARVDSCDGLVTMSFK